MLVLLIFFDNFFYNVIILKKADVDQLISRGLYGPLRRRVSIMYPSEGMSVVDYYWTYTGLEGVVVDE